MACFSYIGSWYNPVRLQSALERRSPMAYGASMQPQGQATVHRKQTDPEGFASVPVQFGLTAHQVDQS